MNGNAPDRELPELSDTQIALLEEICDAASQSIEGPFQALTDAYTFEFQQRRLNPDRDNAILRWYLRIGDRARPGHVTGYATDFHPHLKAVLHAHGYQVIDGREENGKTYNPDKRADTQLTNAAEEVIVFKPKRRVSYDDARLEETWLSERSQFARSSPAVLQNDSLKPPPHNFIESDPVPQARSLSSDRNLGPRKPAPKHFQNASPSSGYESEYEEPRNPTLFFEPSLTQLEHNAEAFCATSELRHSRQVFRSWHDQAIFLRSQRAEALHFASQFDRTRLLRESFDYWRGICQSRWQQRELGRQENEQEIFLESILDNYLYKRDVRILDRSFSHWYGSAVYQIRANEHTREQLLRRRYFTKWRNYAVENLTKARSILSRKYLALWRDRTARRLLVHEQAEAQYEEALEKRCLRRWLRYSRESLAAGKHEISVIQRAFTSWLIQLHIHRAKKQHATTWHNRRLATSAMRNLTQCYQVAQQASLSAKSRYDQKLTSSCMRDFRIEVKLNSLAATLSLKISLDLKRKILHVWQLHTTLSRQATEVSGKRILQSAWTAWNDKLRCTALTRRIDQRIVAVQLHKWMLQTRLKGFQRSQEQKLLQRTLKKLHATKQHMLTTLEQASASFAENQRWRRQKYGMLSLNIAVRRREDAERTAIEFSNGRVLPDVLVVFKYWNTHMQKLAKWAASARFYWLTTRTITIWQKRTTERKHQRRREAYAHIRTRVKMRIVQACFDRWQAKTSQVISLKDEAENRVQARAFRVGAGAFDAWRNKSARYAEFDFQATAADQRKLLSSALSALVNQRADMEALGQQALLFRQEADLSLLASAFRKVQWAMFTATRRHESAEALWARNRRDHEKYMLRHWASQVAVRKAAKNAPQLREPESPSLRPASRAASRSRSRSAERSAFDSSSPAQAATPGYMRTPSRTRRAGRFRPLPTPAHVTPMTFDRAYFVTTPAPPGSAQPSQGLNEDRRANDVFGGSTPMITPFARKLRAGGVAPPSALRSSILGRSMGPGGGTSKSVRFAGSSRFGSGQRAVHASNE